MPEARLYDVARRHRAELLAGEREAAGNMVRVYSALWQRIQARLAVVLTEIDEAIVAGVEVDEGWLWRQERFTWLLRQVEDELARYAQYVGGQVGTLQADAVQAAQAHAEQQTRVVLNRIGLSRSWVRLPAGALEDLIGFTAQGSPLRELLDRLGPAASALIRQTLFDALGMGWNPEKTARLIQGAFGNNLTRALRVSRTETMRVYREASRREYQVNEDVIDGWVWNAACTPRTCAMCWAMHGTLHTLDERLDDHPNGRCVMLPHVRGVAQWQPEPGVSQFDRLSAEDQQHVLGPLYDAYASGQIVLSDVVGRKFDRDWGSMRYVRSPSAILKDK